MMVPILKIFASTILVWEEKFFPRSDRLTARARAPRRRVGSVLQRALCSDGAPTLHHHARRICTLAARRAEGRASSIHSAIVARTTRRPDARGVPRVCATRACDANHVTEAQQRCGPARTAAQSSCRAVYATCWHEMLCAYTSGPAWVCSRRDARRRLCAAAAKLFLLHRRPSNRRSKDVFASSARLRFASRRAADDAAADGAQASTKAIIFTRAPPPSVRVRRAATALRCCFGSDWKSGPAEDRAAKKFFPQRKKNARTLPRSVSTGGWERAEGGRQGGRQQRSNRFRRARRASPRRVRAQQSGALKAPGLPPNGSRGGATRQRRAFRSPSDRGPAACERRGPCRS